MKGIDGIRLAKALRGENGTTGLMPNVPIVFMSGDLGRYKPGDLEVLTPYFLDKPFENVQLQKIVGLALLNPS